MSELFYSAAELAAMQLPNFPTTRQAVDYRAKREGWHVTVKKGIGARGRLNVYALNDLPKDLRTAIQAKTASDLLEKAKESKPVVRRPSQAGLPLDTVIKGYNQKQIACAHARMSLVAEVLHIHRTNGMPVHKAVALMVEQIELGTLNEAMMKLVPIANNKSGGASKIGQRSLAGWVAAYKKAGSPNERLWHWIRARVNRSCRLRRISGWATFWQSTAARKTRRWHTVIRILPSGTANSPPRPIPCQVMTP